MLWFGDLLLHSLINPNQLRAYGINVNDDPLDSTREFGIDSKTVFIPFDTMGTVVHFESRVPTEWEKTHLPIILITSEEWNPSEEVLHPGKQSHENIEMRTMRSFTSGMTSRQIHSVTKEEARMLIERNGETEVDFSKISCVYNPKEFCEQRISTVNIVTMYQDDINQLNSKKRVSSIISNERHSKVMPDEIAHKWNIGIRLPKTPSG
jgi:hypothetical protein